MYEMSTFIHQLYPNVHKTFVPIIISYWDLTPQYFTFTKGSVCGLRDKDWLCVSVAYLNLHSGFQYDLFDLITIDTAYVNWPSNKKQFTSYLALTRSRSLHTFKPNLFRSNSISNYFGSMFSCEMVTNFCQSITFMFSRRWKPCSHMGPDFNRHH